MLGHSNTSPSFRLGNKNTKTYPVILAGEGPGRVGKEYKFTLNAKTVTTGVNSFLHLNGSKINVTELDGSMEISATNATNTVAIQRVRLSRFVSSEKSNYFGLLHGGVTKIFNVKDNVLSIEQEVSGTTKIALSAYGQYIAKIVDNSVEISLLKTGEILANIQIEGKSGLVAPTVAQFSEDDKRLIVAYTENEYLSIASIELNGREIGEVSYIFKGETWIQGVADKLTYKDDNNFVIITDINKMFVRENGIDSTPNGDAYAIYVDAIKRFVFIDGSTLNIDNNYFWFNYHTPTWHFRDSVLWASTFNGEEVALEYTDVSLLENKPVYLSGVAISEDRIMKTSDDFSGYVPASRKINGKELYTDINITLNDVEDTDNILEELLESSRVKILDENFIVIGDPVKVVKTQLND